MISSPQSKMVSMMEIQFIHSLKKQSEARTPEDLDIIYYFLRGMESLATFREPALRAICRNVRYQYHDSNDVLYCRGETASCWYILLSGSVFIDGSMYLPRNSFGKRIAGCSRRASECLILEPSEMIVIDYPENQFMKPGQRSSGSGMNFERLLSIENEEGRSSSRGRYVSETGSDGRTEQSLMRPGEHFHKRSSRASDTSSAYSGSDLMQSSLEDQDVDFTGLRESLVDSDDEEGEESSINSLIVRDTVRECLEKEPSERTEDDIEILLDFMQHFPAFANMTLATRRALCAVMVYAVVENADTVVMNDGEELDSWSVILNGRVEVEKQDGSIEHYHLGASFGITQATLEKQYHKGVMKTKVDDCQFVCIAQEDYYKILSEGEENTQRVEEAGHVVLVTEKRELDGGNRKGKIVIRGTPEKLTRHLVEEHSAVDPTYVDDFLLTYRTFLRSPMEIADKLITWFNEAAIRDRVTRVMLLWVNNHFNDFETVPQMGDFLERFEQLLERENLTGPLRLLNIACAAKARPRTIVLTRATREEILHFSVLGGMERGCGIFITKVEKNSKAHESGLKRGDQILDVNNYSFERISHSRALEILRGTTHLAVTVKSNLRAFKEMLEMPDSSPNSPSRSTKKDHSKVHTGDAKHRLTSDNSVPPVIQSPAKHSTGSSSSSKHRDEKKGGSLSSGHKTKIRRALMKFNFLPRTVNSDSQLNSLDDNLSNFSRSRKGSSSSNNSLTNHQQHLSASNPDLSTLDQYEDLRTEFPEHVLKVYKADQMCKYLLVHRETTSREVVMLGLKEFGLTDPSSNYSLCEVSVEPEGLIKQKRLPDQMTNLPDRITLNGRYYLKNNMSTDTLVPDEMAGDLLREMQTSFLQLNSAEVAAQLMLRDFQLFRDIESTEYIDDLYELNSKFGAPHLAKFSQLVNKEMFWVVTEVCSEPNVVKRMKVIKQFIKIARHCKDCKNFNSMFAIVSGLGHGSVSRLKGTWDKLPSKYVKLFEDLQDLMDPSRNMSKYRNLVNSEMVQPPLIPFFPVVKKDLTFIHLGNDSKVESLINFEKLRMIAKEVRHTCNMASAQYDINSMYYSFGTSQSVFSAFLGSSVSAVATLRRKRRSATIPNPKKMFEEAQMVRRVRAYLDTMKVTEDEGKLNELSLQCEAPAGGTTRKRDPSPGPANLANLGPKFGAESPEAVRKMLALSDKVRPHNPKYPTSQHHHHSTTAPPSRSPLTRRRPASPKQKRPPPPPVAVNLSPESSSVLSLSGINHRKSTATTSTCSNESNSPTNSVGSTTSATQPNMCDTDSGHNSLASSNYDSHSTSSVGSTSSPPIQKRPQSTDVHQHPLPTSYLQANHLGNHHHHANHTNGHSSNHHSHNSTGPPPAYHPPPSRMSQPRPPLPPYHVVMQNNPAYSNYVQQQYQYLRSGRRPPVPPDYHVATQMVHGKRDRAPHYAKTHSYDGVSSCTYFPDMEDENEELVDDLADLDIGSMGDEEEVVSAV